MRYVVIRTSGTQLKVSEGEEVAVNRLSGKEGETVEFNEVLLSADEGKVKIGKPTLKEVKVKAKIIKHFLGDKLHIFKFKAKTGYRRKTGFRPSLTLVKILPF